MEELIFETYSDYLEALISPIKYWLIAYDRSGNGLLSESLCDIFGVSKDIDVWENLHIAEQQLEAATATHIKRGIRLPFLSLSNKLSLSSFEKFSLMLALAYELDDRIGVAMSLFGQKSPTVSFALRLFSSGFKEKLSLKGAWLENINVLNLLFDGLQSNSSDVLALRRGVLKFLLGRDIGAKGLSLFVPSKEFYYLSSPESETRLSELDCYINTGSSRGAVILRGRKGVGKKHLIKKLAHGYECTAAFIDADKASDSMPDIMAAAILTGEIICICHGENDKATDALVDSALELMSSVFITANDDYAPSIDFPILEYVIAPPDAELRHNAWDFFLRNDGVSCNYSNVVSKYDFTYGQIREALSDAEALSIRRGKQLCPTHLDEGCKAQLSRKVGSLMRIISPTYTWNDLILPQKQKQLLQAACNRIKFSSQVYETWRMGAKLPYGKGVSMLFCGPPGTGKTMAAEVISSELGMELLKVNISALVSKYVGDTEKHLAQVFEDARQAGGVLFFDEADVLFGKRGNQNDSHDRYANMQTAYLLQAVEDYEGILILATNLIQNVDSAFMRRLTVRVDFPSPGSAERREIWYSLLSPELPLSEDLDIDYLAEKHELTGAEIKNTVLSAAFIAAAEDGVVGMDEIRTALFAELSKSGRIVSFDDWE